MASYRFTPTIRLDVQPSDLANFDALHDLLLALNDPYAAGGDLTQHIERIPLLRARLLRTARLKTGHLDMTELGRALAMLGNKGLEIELLQLLEDMTIAKADLG